MSQIQSSIDPTRFDFPSMTESQKQLLSRVDRACQELRPIEDQHYLARTVNRELPQIFHRAGALGFLIPEQYGGVGTDLQTYVWALERIGREGTGPRTFFSCHLSIGAGVVAKWGNDEQKKRYLPSAADGSRIFGFGLTEPEAGSNPAQMRTTYEKTSNGFLLNGGKRWIGNAAEGGSLVTFARDRMTAKISAFIVDSATPGYRAELIPHKLGIPTSGTCEVTFERCEVPASNLLGEPGRGLSVAFSTLMSGRMSVAAGSLGVMVDSLLEALNYARSREMFGKPIGRHQLVQRHLGRMAVRLEASRGIVRAACELKAASDANPEDLDLRTRADVLIAAAKYQATNAASESADDAVQVFGGNGFLLTNRPARHLADARACQIYEGTNEILELKIASSYLGKEFEAYSS